MKHNIPKTAKNSDIVFNIDEYVRLERDREILKNHWFGGMTFEQLAEENKLSVNAVKNIIYKIGDEILLKVK